MPCQDTHAVVEIQVDQNQRLQYFDFVKNTCQQSIGQSGLCLKSFKGMLVSDILASDFRDEWNELSSQDEQDEFLLFMQWQALTSSLKVLLGEEDAGLLGIDVVMLEMDNGVMQAKMLVNPPREMPKIVSCASQQRKVS